MNPEKLKCPACSNIFAGRVFVLRCGHSVCLECINLQIILDTRPFQEYHNTLYCPCCSHEMKVYGTSSGIDDGLLMAYGCLPRNLIVEAMAQEYSERHSIISNFDAEASIEPSNDTVPESSIKPSNDSFTNAKYNVCKMSIYAENPILDFEELIRRSSFDLIPETTKLKLADEIYLEQLSGYKNITDKIRIEIKKFMELEGAYAALKTRKGSYHERINDKKIFKRIKKWTYLVKNCIRRSSGQKYARFTNKATVTDQIHLTNQTPVTDQTPVIDQARVSGPAAFQSHTYVDLCEVGLCQCTNHDKWTISYLFRRLYCMHLPRN